jgi:hypothetical protein
MLQRVPIQAQDGRLLTEGSDGDTIYATPRAREGSISRGVLLEIGGRQTALCRRTLDEAGRFCILHRDSDVGIG